MEQQVSNCKKWSTLASITTEDGKSEVEIKRRIEIPRNAFNNMKSVLSSRNIRNECRLLILFDLSLGTQFLLNRINFSLGTQAFASPPDMASYGVWENIIPTKTPTFKGVCGMLYFIIFLNICQMFDFVDRW